MLRFSLFGFPVGIHWMFWVVMALLGGAGGALDRPGAMEQLLIWIGVGLVSILWHELGHAFLQRKYGAQPQIILYGGGGLAVAHGARFTRTQSFIVSAAGPTFGLMLAAVAWLVLRTLDVPSGTGRSVLATAVFINVAWTVINLLPVMPLDGGHMLSAVLGGRRQLVAGIGVVVAAAAAFILYGYFGQLYAAIMFGFFAFENLKVLRAPAGAPPPVP